MSERSRYPLSWPAGWKRTPPSERKSAKFVKKMTTQQTGYKFNQQISVSDALGRIAREMRALKIDEGNVIVSTNIPTRLDGLPRSDRAEPTDPGAAVYWSTNDASRSMAIDQYDRVADNLAAIAVTLEYLRGISRHGGGEILDRAFQGFAALPMPQGRSWREVLDFPPGTDPSEAIVVARFLDLARKAHPDAGGTHEGFIELVKARDLALVEIAK